MDKAERVVDWIIEDLTGRRGLRQEWEQIDEDIQKVIITAWTEAARAIIEEKE